MKELDLENVDLEQYANRILEGIDYDIYKEDVVYGDGCIRDGVEVILEDLLEDIKSNM